jgi:hypothetical protein
MFDIIKKSDFKHSFDEIFEYGVKDGLYREADRTVWKIFWDYLNEAKDAKDLQQFISPDERSPVGRYALKLRKRYELHPRYNFRAEYKALRAGERRLVRLENGNL